ncbi:hypothetical protein BDBG_16220, partial [Blastomyces gilchristii SLH14081]
SSYIDRSAFINDSELNVESLIENLKNVIMKKLSVSCIIRSFIFFSASSVTVSLSVTLSQSSILNSVSDSPALTISIPVTLTLTTSTLSASVISAFIISSSHFKKILYRLNESHFSVKNIHVFRNRNMNIILFYILALASEIILIEDDNITETTLFCSQASSITCSLFSVKKIVHILSY